MPKTKEGYGRDPKREFNYGYESGKQAQQTGKHEPWTSQTSKNFEHPFNKPYGKGYHAGYYGFPKTVGNNPMPTVGSSQPHGYGHTASQRDGHLRLSGNPKAHRIGKR